MDTTSTDAEHTVKRKISAPYMPNGKLWHILNKYPSLLYLSQTDSLYLVRMMQNHPAYVSKNRKVVPPYPPGDPSPLADSYRWLGWAAVGLLFAGIITVVATPFAAFTALPSLRTHNNRHAVTVLISAGILFVIGLVFSGLLVMHIIY